MSLHPLVRTWVSTQKTLSQCRSEHAAKQEFKIVHEAIKLLSQSHYLVYYPKKLQTLNIWAYSDASFTSNQVKVFSWVWSFSWRIVVTEPAPYIILHGNAGALLFLDWLLKYMRSQVYGLIYHVWAWFVSHYRKEYSFFYYERFKVSVWYNNVAYCSH